MAAWRLVLPLALVVTGCASGPPEGVVTGLAVVRNRLVLPQEAVFEAALVDVTDPGSPPLVLGRQRIDDAGSPPYALAIAFDSQAWMPGRRYQVWAGVTVNQVLRLDTPGLHPVLVSPQLRQVAVTLAPVPLEPGTAQAGWPLRQTYWLLRELVGAGPVAAPAPGADAAHLVLEREANRAVGSGGCNRFAFRFALDSPGATGAGAAGQEAASGLRFDELQSGLRLCLEGGTSELALLQRLLQVRQFHQQADWLELRDGAGQPLLRFQAREAGLARLPSHFGPLLPQ